jgi:[acyl-carrier-protein] S-malonyltransferase
MGQDVYRESAAARAIFDTVDETLGFSLSRLCFEGPSEVLTATENTQPAVMTTSLALLAAFAEQAGVDMTGCTQQHARFVAGHSLGEYSALVAADALDLPEAVRLVRRRGELMAAAQEGAMAAVIGMDASTLLEICHTVGSSEAPVMIANYNAPGQLIISGAPAAVERAGEVAKEQGATYALPIKVSGAFHSPLMRQAADDLAIALQDVAFRHPRVAVISNVSATPLVRAETLCHELVTQMMAPVDWIASVQYMVANDVNTFIEIGPGNLLTRGMIQRIVPKAHMMRVNTFDDVQKLLMWLASRPSELVA